MTIIERERDCFGFGAFLLELFFRNEVLLMFGCNGPYEIRIGVETSRTILWALFNATAFSVCGLALFHKVFKFTSSDKTDFIHV